MQKLDETTHNKLLVQELIFRNETTRINKEVTEFTQKKEQEFAQIQKIYVASIEGLVAEYCKANDLKIEEIQIDPISGEVKNANNTGL